MSLVLSGIKLPFESDEREAVEAAQKQLRLSKDSGGVVCRRSIDLRKGQLSAVYAVQFDLVPEQQQKLLQKSGKLQLRERKRPTMPQISGQRTLNERPIIIGLGPAGLFAALILSENGYAPIVFERGGDIDSRDKSVEDFFCSGSLDENSNIQFGEGGAGAYSDGKLTTRINSEQCDLVIEQLVRFGAPPSIAIDAKPHIGTDLLKIVVKNIRKHICSLGAEIHFNTPVERIMHHDGVLTAIEADKAQTQCEVAVLAIGHSARDTFSHLHESGVELQQKPFSVGVRIEHRQSDIEEALYGQFYGTLGLPRGEYALSHREGERACYTFCMCPGGVVVAAASEQGGVVTNGMSYHARDGQNANSALCVSVSPSDLQGEHPLAGIEFQRKMEKAAFASGGGNFRAPAQQVKDFLASKPSTDFGEVMPTYPIGTHPCDLSTVLPGFVTDMMKNSLPILGRKLAGFDAPHAIMTGIESRTSSPVRIVRGQDLESTAVKGLMPCGEGAGYAGGIVSAAVDGIKVATAIMQQYRPKSL